MQLLCPKYQNLMDQYERNRVLVDQCTECKGIFLDRGELEHLIEAEKAYYESRSPTSHSVAGDPRVDERRAEQPYDPRPHAARPYDERRYGDHDRDRDRDEYDRNYKKRRRSSMFEDIFDF